MFVDLDSYRGMKAKEFEADSADSDPFKPARDALDFARETANGWNPGKWAADAQAFAQQTAGGLARSLESAATPLAESLDQQGLLEPGGVQRRLVEPVVEGVREGAREIWRQSPLGGIVDPYSDEEAIARTQPQQGPFGTYEPPETAFVNMLRQSRERTGQPFTPEDEARAARLAIAGTGVAIGAGEPLRPTGRAVVPKATTAPARTVEAAPPAPPIPPETPPAGGANMPPEPGGGRGAEANRILDEMYSGKTTKRKMPDAWDWVDRNFFSRGRGLAALQEETERLAGRPLDWTERPADLVKLDAVKASQVKLQEGLAPSLQRIGEDLPELAKYLTFRQNMEAARALENPNRVFSGGLSAEDSRFGIVDQARRLGPERFERLETTAGAVQDFVRSIWNRKLRAGLISQEFHDAMSERYPYFVPTRILDYMREGHRMARGESLSVNDAGVRKYTFEGTEQARENPIESVVRYTQETEVLAKRNEAFNAFVKMREAHPLGESVIREMPESYKPARGESVLHGFTDGKKRTFVVPEDVAKMIEQDSGWQAPRAINAMMTLFKAGATSRNAVFLAANALNDAATFSIRSTIREGGPRSLPLVLRELAGAYGDAFQGIASGTYKGAATSRYLKQGGGMFGFYAATTKDASKLAGELTRRNAFDIKSAGDLLRLAGELATLKPVEVVGERIELAPRVAAMRLAEKRGGDWVNATVQGRNVTIDFNEGGTVSRMINQFVPFFNVGLQGAAQPVRAFRENPKGFLATGATLLAAPTVMVEAWNRSDPQRAQDYEDVPDYIKNMGVVVMLPTQAPVDEMGNRRPQFLLLRTREYTPIVNLTREAATRALGGQPEAWQDLIRDSVASVSPVATGSAAEAIGSFTLPGLGTGLQLATNRDWFRGRDVATRYGDEKASAGSKAVAKGLGKVAETVGVGGEPRPSQVEFAVRDVATGVGGMVLGATDLAAGTPRKGGASEVPVVGGLANRFIKGNIGGRLEREQENTTSPAVRAVLREAGIPTDVGAVEGSIFGLPLTREEQAKYQSLVNKYVEERVTKLAGSSLWAGRTTAMKEKLIRSTIDKAREKARNETISSISVIERQRRRKQQKEKP